MAVLDLPLFAGPATFTASFNDPGFTQRAVQSDDYIPRKGGRYTVGFTFGPYAPNQGRVMVARLIAGKQGGVRVKLPLLHGQGNPGSPVVSSASGRMLGISGLTPGYAALEGYWLSLVKDGRHYLHSIGIGATAGVAGTITVELNELLRDTFAPGTPVHLAQPQVEGLLQGDDFSWSVGTDRLFPIAFTIKEVR